MSFLSVLEKIDGVLDTALSVGRAVSPVVSLVPAAGSVFNAVMTTVTVVEKLLPDAKGEIKKDVAVKMVTASHPEVDPAAISSSIDNLVASLNALRAPQVVKREELVEGKAEAKPPAAEPDTK